MRQLKITEDGSHTIYVPSLDEHYHSVHGAIRESSVVFIKNGYDRCPFDEINLLEIGFGTGLNALLTMLRASDDKRHVTYTAIEKHPLGNDITGELNYGMFGDSRWAEAFRSMHSAPWEKEVVLSDYFRIRKVESDFTTFRPEGNFNLIYFDAFAPDKQPEMWQENLFRKLGSVAVKGAVFATYSAKGTVKRMLRDNGFVVTLVAGPPGKRHTITAVKN